MYTLEEFMSRVAERYDPDVILDLLDLSSNELIQAFPEKFIAHQHRFDLAFSTESMDYFLVGEIDEPGEET